MVRLLAIVMLSGVAAAQSSGPGQAPGQNAFSSTATNSIASTTTTVAPAASTALPAPPRGKSTVIGGEIREVDPVRDQLTLKVFGNGASMKILFDERTQVYRNGQKIPVLSLHPEDHASIETTLDGTKIFALRIHMLTQVPEGEAQGQVLSYNPGTGELTLNATLSRQSIKLRVPAGTPVARVGQKTFTAEGGTFDLARGALVNVKFQAGSGNGQGVATHIDVLATPGSAFVFGGNLSFFDLHAGRMVILDPNDNESYQVSFDASRFPESRELHEGSRVRVTANFDGSRYVASAITIE